MNQLFPTFLIVALSAGSAAAQDVWSVVTPEGEVTQDSPAARVGYARSALWEFRAGGFVVRLQPSFADGADETIDFVFNNTLASMQLTVDGRSLNADCRPADPPVGRAERLMMTDSQISGRFELEIVRCEEYVTSSVDVAYDGLPFTITGEFTLERKE